jgi:glucosylceramidase
MKKTHENKLINILILALLFFNLSSCGKTPKKDPTVTPPVVTPPSTTPVKTDVAFWLTKADRTALFEKQNVALIFNTGTNLNQTITIDSTQTFQTIDGFGFAMTGGSAYLINHLGGVERDALMKELFTPDSTFINVSYLRISVGSSDLNSSVFSYDDIPSGQTDYPLDYFSLAPDTYDLIPILKQVVTLNPNIKILACPWSAPSWMKTNNNPMGGSLKPECYAVYAQYFVKYIQGMKANGIHIDAITCQNEPLNAYNNPSMLMTALQQADFIKNNLGPAFQAANLDTKIILYDHNCDHPEYPTTVLSDPDAKKYVDGSAFHLYAGDISALSTVHNAYPDKNVYFTEQWTGGPGNFATDLNWHVKQLIVGATRNWSKNVIEWNLAADPLYQPHTAGGCTTCMGALTIGSTVTRNVSYYIIAHASKFVKPGSVRIASTITGTLPNVAFMTPDRKKVLIVLNDNTVDQTFNIMSNGKQVTTTLAAGSVGTYIW